MHTYEEIYQKWRREWTTAEIQSVTDEFCEAIGEYFIKNDPIGLYEELTPLEDALFGLKLERLNFLIRDFFYIRMRKIVARIIERTDIDFTKLSSIEDRLCSNLKDAIDTYLSLSLENQATGDEELKSKRRIVRIIGERLDSFVGTDLQIYGPFMPEDIITLPSENAKALVDRNVAVLIQTRMRNGSLE